MRKILLLLLCVLALPAHAQTWNPTLSVDVSPFMRTFGETEAPKGFYDFCRREPAACRADGRGYTRVVLDIGKRIELANVNEWVNDTIEQATDAELYGRSDYWTFPRKKGDCEDSVLLKRKILMERGWPASALLITVVRDERGDGHAVLTARTNSGDFILDNKTNEIRMWYRTPYEFISRQSYISEKIWVRLN